MYDHDFWFTYVKWWQLRTLFSFLQDFDFLGCGTKWQKTLSCFTSQEPYIIWSSFMVHMSERIISPGMLVKVKPKKSQVFEVIFKFSLLWEHFLRLFFILVKLIYWAILSFFLLNEAYPVESHSHWILRLTWPEACYAIAEK